MKLFKSKAKKTKGGDENGEQHGNVSAPATSEQLASRLEQEQQRRVQQQPLRQRKAPEQQPARQKGAPVNDTDKAWQQFAAQEAKLKRQQQQQMEALGYHPAYKPATTTTTQQQKATSIPAAARDVVTKAPAAARGVVSKAWSTTVNIIPGRHHGAAHKQELVV
jgi:hypothetical protein